MSDSSTSEGLNRQIGALRRIFAENHDKYAAHAKARSVLQDMAASSVALTTMLDRHLVRSGSLNVKHYPVVSLEVETNADFGVVANCWIPLPDGGTDMSTKAIHHHGQMLLTTVTAFGPGYEHWMFTPPEPVEPESELYTMRLVERASHPIAHAAFVDANVGHVPFFPASLSITLALWSSRRATTWRDNIKRVPSLHKHSMALRKIAASAGLTGLLDLKIARYFDFFPVAEGFRGMKEREEFGRGPNTDYLRSLFHILQRTGNEGLAPRVRAALNAGVVENRELLETLLTDLDRGVPIQGRLSAGHYGVPFANFSAKAVEQALAACATHGTLSA